MSGVLDQYGALTTKVKAMYGRRLRYEDFQRMAAMTSVPAVLDYLRQTSWAGAMARLDALPLNRANLESVLQEQTREEYVRLASFAPRSDRALLSYPVRLAELQGIMTSLRRLKAGRILDPLPLSDRFLLHSKMDYKLLATCTNYDGLIAAAQHSIYADALRSLRPEQPVALPEYNVTETLLHTVYFTDLYRSVKKHYGGEVKSVLLSALGQQIDLLNIIHLLRMKVYFPDQSSDPAFLFPFHYRMKPAQLRELAAAPTAQAVFDKLQSSPYASAFRELNIDEVNEVEDYYRTAMYRFHRHQVISGLPSIGTAVSYLHLKDAEVSALINVIESVNYGVSYDDSFVRLIGA